MISTLKMLSYVYATNWSTSGFSDVFRGYRSETLVENGLSQKFSFVPQNLILTKYLISVAAALIYESNDVKLFRNQI